jgi:hypothetical protein
LFYSNIAHPFIKIQYSAGELIQNKETNGNSYTAIIYVLVPFCLPNLRIFMLIHSCYFAVVGLDSDAISKLTQIVKTICAALPTDGPGKS